MVGLICWDIVTAYCTVNYKPTPHIHCTVEKCVIIQQIISVHAKISHTLARKYNSFMTTYRQDVTFLSSIRALFWSYWLGHRKGNPDYEKQCPNKRIWSNYGKWTDSIKARNHSYKRECKEDWNKPLNSNLFNQKKISERTARTRVVNRQKSERNTDI